MESPVAQQRFLAGITFPAQKEQVIAGLQRNGAKPLHQRPRGGGRSGG